MLVFTFIHQGVLRAGRHLCVSDKPGALLAWKAVGTPRVFFFGKGWFEPEKVFRKK